MTTINQYIDFRQQFASNLILAPSGNLGINRESMPQIDGKHKEEFISWLRKKGIKVKYDQVPVSELKMIQMEYNRSKVLSIILSIKDGSYKKNDIFISNDGYVLDGNHRFLAVMNAGEENIDVVEIGLDAKTALETMCDFPKVAHRGQFNK